MMAGMLHTKITIELQLFQVMCSVPMGVAIDHLAVVFCEGCSEQPAAHACGLWAQQAVSQASSRAGAPPDDLPPGADRQSRDA